jgi:hypothetical protein
VARATRRQPPATRPAAAAATDDWAAAASFDPADPDFSAFLDGLATRFAKAALAGDERALVPGSDWHSDVADLGQAAAAGGALAAARFAYCLLECAGHRWPQAEVDGLEPPYDGALEKVHALLEDSGWRLVRPGEEGSGTAGIDEAWE